MFTQGLSFCFFAILILFPLGTLSAESRWAEMAEGFPSKEDSWKEFENIESPKGSPNERTYQPYVGHVGYQPDSPRTAKVLEDTGHFRDYYDYTTYHTPVNEEEHYAHLHNPHSESGWETYEPTNYEHHADEEHHHSDVEEHHKDEQSHITEDHRDELSRILLEDNWARRRIT